jgi:hypothetical protein
MSTFTLDVTGAGYDGLDLELSTLFVPVPRLLPETLTFEVWGAILKPSDPAVLSRLEDAVDFDLGKGSGFLAGHGVFTFEGLRALEMFVALYEPGGPGHLLRSQSNEVVRLEQHLGTRAADAIAYNLGGTLAWPSGNCALDLWATGRASLTFDPGACIPTSQAISNIEAVRNGSMNR